MSKFEQAAARAAGGAKAAAPKVVATKVVASKPKAAPKPVELKTLDEKKAYVKKHDMKMDDAAENVKNEPNKATKKELESALKTLKADPTYLQAKIDIKEAEAQAIRDAERAALEKTSTASKAGAKAKTDKADKEEKAKDTTIDVETIGQTMQDLDAALAATGKDAAPKKEAAVKQLMELAPNTPFVLPRLEKLISLFSDTKLGGPAVKAACAIVEGIKPKGHAVASLVVPLVLAGMEDKKWKMKAGCIDVLVPCLKQMENSTPSQLAGCLPFVVPKLAEAALEVRAEIRTATGAVLREIGSLVSSPEIKKLSQDLVTALAEPTNQKHTQAVLAKMGNQTFLSLIDAASLAILMPVVVRGLKERDSASKKWSAQIVGSTAILVQDVEIIRPYLKTVVPLLQEALSDPVQEVQREAAKAFGVFEQVLPDYSRQHCQAWLFDRLRKGEIGEQTGAAMALAEVLLKMDKTTAAELMPEIEAGGLEENIRARRGFMELMDTMPNAMKMDFVPYISRLFPVMMMGISGDKDGDAGMVASLSLVQRFGDLCPDLLMQAFENVYFVTLQSSTPEEEQRNQTVRERAAGLLGKTAEKILEHKKFGQDLLTTEDCSSKDTREYLLTMIFIMRSDPDAGVKRNANGVWKTAGGAPKVQKLIGAAIQKLLGRMRKGELGTGAQTLAGKVTEELVKAGEMEAPAGDEPEKAARFAMPPPEGRVPNSEASVVVAGRRPDGVVDETGEFKRQFSGGASGARGFLESHVGMNMLPEDIRSHLVEIAASTIMEGTKRKATGPKIAAALADQLKAGISFAGEKGKAVEAELPLVAEAATRAALGDKFDALVAGGADDAQTLLYVESLLLMYGAGHLLLRDTTLVMKKNQRYGVVGQNGAGKTTLMKEIAGHRIVGMPQDIKCVHVDDSKLSLMSTSCLNTLEYVIKMAKEIGVHDAGRETLIGVGFAENMLAVPVADLSTGWRMRLTLAVSMLKSADVVLLDEPTNHLDEESVEWLGDYILSIKDSSVMVISHSPAFLNKICTHIIAYVDKKLEYTEGDFTAFAARKGLTQDQINAMLSGNLSFNTKKEGEEEEEEGEDAGPKVAAPVSGPPKLSFPIPGTMEGVKSGSRSVLETKNLSFRFSKEKDFLINEVSLKLNLNARVAICGRNGCGKSVLMTLLCSEASPSEGKDGSFGEVWRHCNLRLAYMKQDHLKSLGPFFDTSPFVYITDRFKDGWDGDLQKRLIEPEDAEEAERRMKLAKEHGKYGNEVEELVTRTKMGNGLAYEVRWKGLDDPKQNTIEPLSKLKAMGLDKVIIACDERIAAKAAGLDQRPLTRREVIRHCEAFGIDEEMCCNRQIRGFSAGQKVRLSLAAMFWTKPHLIALDEPTNYLDVETVEALVKALNTFRGGIVMIEPKTDFVDRVCNEKWHLENGTITVEKMKNGAKRQA